MYRTDYKNPIPFQNPTLYATEWVLFRSIAFKLLIKI